METERCVLMGLQEEDREDIFKLYENEDVRKFLGGVFDRERFAQYFDSKDLKSQKHMCWAVRLKANGGFIGIIEVNPYHGENDQEISYQFLPKFWGQGFAKETMCAVLEYVRCSLGYSRIVAETQTKNTNSIKLLETLGMRFVKSLVRFDAEQSVYCLNFT